jgi:hypothetical protein
LPLTVLLAPLPGGVAPASLPAWAAAHALAFEGLNASALAPNLRVLTLQPLGGAALLLRIAHAHAAGEDPALAANGTAALGPLFAPSFRVTAAVETSAGGVVPLASVKPWALRVQGEGEPVTLPLLPPQPVGPLFEVTLAPMEVRTFVCEVEGF